MAARIRVLLRWRCSALILPLSVAGGCVDLGEDACGPVVLGLQAGLLGLGVGPRLRGKRWSCWRAQPILAGDRGGGWLGQRAESHIPARGLSACGFRRVSGTGPGTGR